MFAQVTDKASFIRLEQLMLVSKWDMVFRMKRNGGIPSSFDNLQELVDGVLTPNPEYAHYFLDAGYEVVRRTCRWDHLYKYIDIVKL